MARFRGCALVCALSGRSPEAQKRGNTYAAQLLVQPLYCFPVRPPPRAELGGAEVSEVIRSHPAVKLRRRPMVKFIQRPLRVASAILPFCLVNDGVEEEPQEL